MVLDFFKGRKCIFFRFTGLVKIVFSAVNPVALIRLHAKDVTILSVSVKLVGPASPPSIYSRHTLSGDDKDFLDIMLTGPLSTAPRTYYELQIEYEGNLNDELDGFYRSSYVNYRGDTV